MLDLPAGGGGGDDDRDGANGDGSEGGDGCDSVVGVLNSSTARRCVNAVSKRCAVMAAWTAGLLLS